MKLGLTSILLIVSLVFAPGWSWGAVFDVTDATELQQALNIASGNGEDDHIKVYLGTYSGNFTYSESNSEENKVTRVEGGYIIDGDPTYDPSITILDGSASEPGNSVLKCIVHGSIMITNLTIQDGSSGEKPGGGLSVIHLPIKSPGFVFIGNNIIQNNHTNEEGGGVYAESFKPQGTAGNVWLVGNKISGNTAEDWGGGGAYLYINTASISRSTGQIFVIGNTITQNSATGETGGSGGGVRIWTKSNSGPAGKVTLIGNTISDNSAEGFSDYGGGGVYIESESEEGLSSSNQSSLNSITLEENVFENNNVGTYGGGIHVKATSEDGIAAAITLTKNTISLNTAERGGGGINAGSRSDSGQGGDVTLSGNMVSENSTTSPEWGQGGGVIAASGYDTAGEVVLTNNIIVENFSSKTDGGVMVSGNVTLTNNTIAKNVAQEQCGGARLTANSFVSAYNNIIRGNSVLDTSIGGDDIILWNPGLFGGFNNDYSAILGTWSAEGGNINQDPLFVGVDDYHIQFISPCRDAGTAGAPHLPPYDYDGEDRIYGSAPDMGADEFALTLNPGAFPSLPHWKLLPPQFQDYIRRVE
jgi:hypothetical protein